jgi:hypothetical protein
MFCEILKYKISKNPVCQVSVCALIYCAPQADKLHPKVYCSVLKQVKYFERTVFGLCNSQATAMGVSHLYTNSNSGLVDETKPLFLSDCVLAVLSNKSCILYIVRVRFSLRSVDDYCLLPCGAT